MTTPNEASFPPGCLRAAPAVLALTLGFLGGCSSKTNDLPSGNELPTIMRGSAGSAASATAVKPLETTQEQYCAGKGPPVVALPATTQRSGTTSGCAPSIAASVFAHGLCSCSDAVFTGAFSIDAFDSGHGTSIASGQSGASVGINDQLLTTGVIDIGGSLIVAGTGPLAITTGGFNIDGNFETNSDLHLTGANIRFGRDLWVNGEISALGISRVDGDVYQTPGHSMFGTQVGGSLFQRQFNVPEPCACREGQVLDIDAIVSEGTALAGTKPGELFSIGTGGTLALGCGRFAYRDVNIVGITVLEAHGRTALFVDGDFTVTGGLATDLGAAGELDIFITGNLLLTGAGQIGARERPSALRFYVGGGGDIAITGANQFAANLYAPRANVVITGADDIYGSFFVGSYYATGAQAMHYDASIQRVGSSSGDCDPPPPRCGSDLECASPNVCVTGACRTLQLGPD